jgi:hypothetical protein
MQIPVARKLLSEMLEGAELEEADVQSLVQVRGETLYIDFKDGAELNDRKEAARTVRRYVAGFANADGGLLVVGVSDGGRDPSRRCFTGVPRPGGQPLPEWARNVLETMAGGLIPPPRIQAVAVGGSEVLVIGVARAPALVPCLEGNDMKYYLRIGDSTPSIPPYLISDLVLGRRVHPQLLVTTREGGSGAANDSAVDFWFDVENEGMVPADDIIVGVVSWALKPRPPSMGRLAGSPVLRYIDSSAKPQIEQNGEPLVLVHVTSRAGQRTLTLPAFEKGSAPSIGTLLVPRGPTPLPVRSALYVMASGHPADWYQLDWVLPVQGETKLSISLTRLSVERPITAWNQEWHQ